jgi:hypothetical protein
MASIASRFVGSTERRDLLSGTPRAHSIDRWIFVFTAVWFIAIVLVGFIPDSLMKVAAVQAAQRPPFPTVLHVHAVLMGSFLLLLLTQAVLMATGRCELHKRVGMIAFALVPMVVVAGFFVAPTIYHQVWNFAQVAPPGVKEQMVGRLGELDNILLLQIRIGILFPLFLAIALIARAGNAGLHKRMMFLATALPLPAAIDRMVWLPTTLPGSMVAADFYVLVAVSPLFVWDVVRNKRVHEAYSIWLAINVPCSVLVYSLWDTAGWHATAQGIMGV